MRTRRLALALVAALTGLAASRPTGAAPESTEALDALAAGKEWLNVAKAPTAADLKGRLILLDFWTFCCINCIHIMPDLKALEKEFGDKLTVIGVHSAKFDNEKQTENIRQAILRYELEHPVVNDDDFKIWRKFGVRGWPTLALVDPEGQLVYARSGEGQLELLRAAITKLLKDFDGKIVAKPLPVALEREKLAARPLRFPGKLAWSEKRKTLIVSDSNHERIVGLGLDGAMTLVIGKKGEAGSADGSFEDARFRKPQGLVLVGDDLFVADTENHLLRRIDLERKTVATVAGTGVQGFERRPMRAKALETALSSPWDLTYVEAKGWFVVAMAGTHQLWGFSAEDRSLQILAGSGSESIDDGELPDNSLSQPSGISAHDGKVYFVDSETSSLRVYHDNALVTLLGKGLFDFGLKDGGRDAARLQHPLGIVADADGIFIADSYNHAIRRYDLATKKIETLAGDGTAGLVDGPFGKARFSEPAGITKVGRRLFVADTNNHRIRVLDLEAKTVATLEVRETAAPAPARARKAPETDLPLLRKSSAAKVAPGKPLELRLDLAPGFELDAGSPSWLAVWKATGEGFTLVSEHEVAALAKPIALPALEAGERYRIQGTFGTCRKGDVCTSSSHDRLVVAEAEADATVVTLDLR